MADVSPASSPAPGLDLGRLLLEGRAFFALIAIVAVFSLLSPVYFSASNFLTMSSQVAIYGLLAVGMLLVILNGGIDLSVGSVLGLAGVVAGALMQGVEIEALGVVLYPPVWAVVLLTCALGALVGAVVAALHTAAEAGCGQAGLHVDSGNVPGAPRLYEGLGFRTRRTQVSWSLALPPARR